MAYAELSQAGGGDFPCNRMGGLYVPGGAAWTPASASGLLGWFDSSLSTMLDGAGAPVANGSSIASAADARGGALFSDATSSKRFSDDTTDAANGHPAIAGTLASLSALASTTGGVTTGSWTLYVVGQIKDGTYPLSNHPLALLGQSDQTKAIILSAGSGAGSGWGMASAGGATAGATSLAATYAHAHDGADQDLYLHLFCLTYDATSHTMTLYVDGAQVLTGSTTLSLSPGWGFAAIDRFSLGADTYQYAAVLRTGVDSAAVRKRHEAYFSERFQAVLVAGLGDSLTFGLMASNGATGPGNGDYVSTYLPPRLRAAGCSHYNFGIAGQRSDQIAARVGSVTALASGVTGICVGMAGTNDGVQQGGGIVPAATSDAIAFTIANLQTMATAIKAAGMKFLVLQIPPMGPSAAGKPATFDAYQAGLNAALAAATWHDGCIAQPAAIASPNWSTTPDFDTDKIHLVALSAGHGYDLMASAVAPYVKALVGLP